MGPAGRDHRGGIGYRGGGVDREDKIRRKTPRAIRASFWWVSYGVPFDACGGLRGRLTDGYPSRPKAIPRAAENFSE